MLKTYEAMVNVCLTSEWPVHFLYFFLKLTDMPDDGQRLFPDRDLAGVDSICTILFDAHEKVKPDMTFTALVEQGDAVNPDWDLVLVMTMRSKNDDPITEDQVRQALARIRAGLMRGDIPSGVPIFDRQGRAREFGRVTPLVSPGAPRH